MATKKTIVAEFDVLKATKNTIRFEEDAGEMGAPVIGGLYIQKHAIPQLGDVTPERIRVTIEGVS